MTEQEASWNYTTAAKVPPPKLPEIYFTRNKYEYFRQPVEYKSRDGKWYTFERNSGALVKIDSSHTSLIWEK